VILNKDDTKMYVKLTILTNKQDKKDIVALLLMLFSGMGECDPYSKVTVLVRLTSYYLLV